MTALLTLAAMLLQFTPPSDLITSVTAEKLRSHIAVLAHDSLEGRAPSSRGDRKATAYIASQFGKFGLKPAGDNGTYIQPVPLVGVTVDPATVLTVSNGTNTVPLAYSTDIVMSTGTYEPTLALKSAPMVFVGYGIVAPEQQWDDYKDVDVRGKILVMMNSDPSTGGPELFAGKGRTYYGRWTYKYEIAAAKGALGAIIIHTTPTAGYRYEVIRNTWSREMYSLDEHRSGDGLGLKAWTTEEATRAYLALAGWKMDSLFALAESRRFRPIPLGLTLNGTLRSTVKHLQTNNIIGRVEGSDPALKDECIIFTAHYDHFGIGRAIDGDSIYNGALDNASGTSLMMTLAEAFSSAPVKPKRSLLFAAVTGEEQGLLGSQYLAEHPPVPLSRLAANLNTDVINVIGRTTDISCQGSDRSSLGDDLAIVTKELGMTVIPDQAPEQGGFYRSDHFSFAKAGVPAMSIGGGKNFVGVDTAFIRTLRERGGKSYHQPSDELYDDWTYDGALQQAEIAIRIAWRVANAAGMPRWNIGSEFEAARKLSMQTRPQAPVFTRADSLGGMLSPERTCYDLTYYHLDVRIDPSDSSVRGSNAIYFKVVRAFDRMQIDLFKNMEIAKIVVDDVQSVPFSREYNAVFVTLPRLLEANSAHHITVYYGGKPIVAKRPPWDGGMTWGKDSTGNPWVVVTSQGTGASLWWPNKDHQADEPDSMLMSITVPKGLMDISNGRLRSTTECADGWTRYDWFVSYPINNYCATINIGKYVHFSDTYGKGKLSLDYYVLPYDLERAKRTFAQVKTMMDAFEKYFGPYPFYRDGYKLVECPHTGMEHQSAVAYGNRYLGGYLGRAPSAAGLKFDFIIIHESAHEWWGNSITAKDVADMWIHESFGAYAEALYVEHRWGYKEALKYINGKKANVKNTEPIIGIYNVQHEGSGDMYDKGQLVLNTLRSVIDNDPMWFSVVKGLQTQFGYQTITAEDVFRFVNEKTGQDLNYFFDQYLKHTQIPQLEVRLTYRGDSTFARYRWIADVKEFHMPVRVTTARNTFEVIHPTTAWQRMSIAHLEPEEFRIDADRFYCSLRLGWVYLDPRRRIEDEK